MTLYYLTTFLITVSSYRFLPEEVRQYSVSNTLHKYVVSSADVPYHVLVVHSNLYCSGSLVRSRIVITAASCLMMRRSGAMVVVKVGADNVADRSQLITVIEVKIHEYFKHLSDLDNDIAMLVLRNNVNFGSKVKKVMMLDLEVTLKTGTSIAVSGWGGADLPSKYANMLLWSEMTVISAATCREYYNHLLTPSNFCVRYQPDRRLSDNGGPAIFKKLLVGILSYGAANNNEPHVALLTNISYFHRWIAINSKIFLSKYCVSRDTEDESLAWNGRGNIA